MDKISTVNKLVGVLTKLDEVSVQGRSNISTLSACLEYLWGMVDELRQQIIAEKEQKEKNKNERDIQLSKPD